MSTVPGTVLGESDAASNAMSLTRDPHYWSETQIAVLSSLSLSSLPPLPPDPSNSIADKPAAAEFGKKLFFDVRLSANGTVSCATCHKVELNFTDGLPRAIGVGVTKRHTMTIVGTAYSPWMFWDGSKDSQWSQALGPLENAVEHGGNRSLYAHILFNDDVYRTQYEYLFGKFPDLSDVNRYPNSAGPVEDPEASAAWEGMTQEDREVITQIFVNMGKAIAAYERLIMPAPSTFDAYVMAAKLGSWTRMQATYTDSQARGLRVFIGKGQCINCHNGPLFTNNDFHNIGVPLSIDFPLDFGRKNGVSVVKNDPFNCLGDYSDALYVQCPDLLYTKTKGPELVAAFKTPSLRNVAESAPYMHFGQIETLAEVIRHYNEAPSPVQGHSSLTKLDFTINEMKDLESFLGTLSSPLAAPADMLKSPWPSMAK
tara:strand:- start:47938 stop:49218 length:1281 start_codon:yes stop_codon:yes gene_type:complete